MMSQRTRPHHLVYWVDECPPKPTMWLLGLQHVVVNSAGWVIMAAVLSAFVKDTRDIEAMVRLGMIVVGVVAILQARKASALGAGLFCPPICGPSYASATIAAGTGFGLGVVYGMTLLAGLFEVALARLMPRLRVLFPPEVIGVIMSVVGFAMLPLAIPRLLASPEFAPSMAGSRGANIAVAFGTLACIYGVTVWAKGRVRLFPVLIGAVVGLIGALILGVVPASAVEKIAQADWIGLPQRVNMDLGFELSLLGLSWWRPSPQRSRAWVTSRSARKAMTTTGNELTCKKCPAAARRWGSAPPWPACWAPWDTRPRRPTWACR